MNGHNDVIRFAVKFDQSHEYFSCKIVWKAFSLMCISACMLLWFNCRQLLLCVLSVMSQLCYDTNHVHFLPPPGCNPVCHIVIE